MAGAKLRSFMAAMTSNAFKRVLTGVVVTALVQSSTATTLMLVSFVNAGLLSLANAIGVIMGANIGTTVTAWIFALSFGGSSFSLGAIAVPLMFFAFLCIQSKSNKTARHLGEFLMGFALLFLGLTTLRETSTVLLDNEPVRLFLSHLTGGGVWSIALFMVVGACMTLMLQSSAATMAITMVLVANGYIPFEMAAAMVLGENIGTTITSNIAASVANVSAKRTARAHLLFNLFGVFWVSCLFHPFLRLIGNIVELFGFPNPITTVWGEDAEVTASLTASLPFVVATLHSLFNIITTLILIWFVPVIEKIVTWMVPSPKGEEEVFRLKYINAGPLSTAELSLKESQQEIAHFGQICRNGLGYVQSAIHAKDEKEFEFFNEKLVKYEEITDRLEFEIATYLGEVSHAKVGSSALARIKGSYRIIGEMESLGDSGESIGRMLMRTYAHQRTFTPEMFRKLDKMISLVDQAFSAMLENLAIPIHEISNINNAYVAEAAINKLRDKLRAEHLEKLEQEGYPYETGVFYIDIINELEKMGDYIINISETLISEKEI